jgi:hypoxanthine-guanine phosphoribosyltransferase
MSPEYSIESATSYEKAVEIIPEEICKVGIAALQIELAESFPDKNSYVVVPVMKGGERIGRALTNFTGAESDPMKMSYYDENNLRLEKPICLAKPDISKILVDRTIKDVIFAECVVESEGTIISAIEEINNLLGSYPHPKYYTYALVSKVNGDSKIPNFKYAFKVAREIWVHGWGGDNNQKGRDLDMVLGVLSAKAEKFPIKPYFRPSDIYQKHFKTILFHNAKI